MREQSEDRLSIPRSLLADIEDYLQAQRGGGQFEDPVAADDSVDTAAELLHRLRGDGVKSALVGEVIAEVYGDPVDEMVPTGEIF